MDLFGRLRGEALSRKEQVAFSELADTLIFQSPHRFTLSRKTVPEFSREVQNDFFRLEEAHSRAKNEYLHSSIERGMQSLPILRGDEPGSEPQTQKDPESTKDRSSPPPIIREGATSTEAFLTTTQLFL